MKDSEPEKHSYICFIENFRKYLFLLIIVFPALPGKAEGIESLLGKTINNREIQHLIRAMEPYKETFLPYAKTYKISSFAAGIDLEFNAYFVLFKINLYDSGYSYKSFQGNMPFNIGWGWDSTKVQNVTDYLEYNETNPYIKRYPGTNYTIDFYFRDNQLELLRLEADTISIINGSNIALHQEFGFRLYPTGKRVSGNIVDGTGTMVWSNGKFRYEGEWLYGVPHGKGHYSDSSGNDYTGEFKLGFFWGDAVFKSPGAVYKGKFLLGKYHGPGTIMYSNGTSYTGDFYKGSMDGWGTYKLTEEYYYVGEMKDNAFNGEGILYTKDGYIKGKFKDGKPHGYCEQFAVQSAQTLKGTWVNGMKQGEFIRSTFGYDQKVMFKDDVEQFPEPKVDE